MIVRKLMRLLIPAGILAIIPVYCHAQSENYPTIEFDFDFRSRLAAVGGSHTELNTSSVRMTSDLASGWKVDLYGANKYGKMMAQQATVEKRWSNQRVQAGIVSVPFGIYDTQETYASGLIDYPLARSDYGYRSVSWGAPGISWSGGTPNLQIEAAGFSGRASGVWNNEDIVSGGAVRTQTYTKGLILGASYWNGYMRFSSGGDMRRSVSVGGVDLRYTQPHLLVRGEFLAGRLGGEQMHGWYLDFYYHLPKYEKITLVARLESLQPASNLPEGRQITLGVRYTATPDWIFAINWRKNNGNDFYPYSWTPYAGRGGDFIFQVYHKIHN